MLRVSNIEYNKARKNGFSGSFAMFAEECNKVNSELLNQNNLISAKKYFNDLGKNSADDFIHNLQSCIGIVGTKPGWNVRPSEEFLKEVQKAQDKPEPDKLKPVLMYVAWGVGAIAVCAAIFFLWRFRKKAK